MGKGGKPALVKMSTAMTRIIQGETRFKKIKNFFQHRNEYPDEEEDSEEDGSNGGYCDEEELATGVRGLL